MSAQSEITGLVNFIDTSVGRFDAQLQAVLEELRNQIITLAGQLTIRDGRIVSDTANLQIALSLQDDIASYLQPWSDAGRDFLSQYPDLLDRVDRILQASGISPAYTGISTDILTELQRLDFNNFAALGEQTLNTFTNQFVRAVASGLGAGELIRNLEDAQVSFGLAKTWAETSMAEFERHALRLQYDQLDENQKFVYRGPDDDLTRPFCDGLLSDSRNDTDQGFTRAEIEAMDNGQIPDVFISGGGYNCRHAWYPAL